MRIHLFLSKNKEIIPFEYQQLLTGVLHKWIGLNTIHNETSLYSFSWLQNGNASKAGITFKNGASWFISAHNEYFIKQIIKGIQNSPTLFNGMIVREIQVQPSPQFKNLERLSVASPIFIKRREGENTRFYYHDNPESGGFLTETLIKKLRIANLDAKDVSVEFDSTYHNPLRKGTTYKGIKSIGSVCPIIIKGTPEQISFAWNVGLGNSTGIGFGALN